MIIESTGTPILYLGFTLLVIVLLAVDFFVLKAQGAHRVSVKEAAAWSMVWIVFSLAFCSWFWWYLDGRFGRELANEKALEYLSGYFIEKSLAVDNVFVWITLFNFFAVPTEFQKRVLLYGVLGAIVMRAVLIYVGALLLAQFHWILYVFGLFLLLTGVKMLVFAKHEPDLEKNPILHWMRGHMKITNEYHGESFVLKEGARYATPMFLVLVLVEVTDLIFAVDSIPAIFAITGDPFLVFTSNVFAILGLRSLYFALGGMLDRFRYLKVALAVVLMVVGVKMLIVKWLKAMLGSGFNFYLLGVVLLILGAGVALSLIAERRDGRAA